ncbi:MAG TPA: hypothetical protein ENI09_01200 [candidate division WWE3 bacterium]|uniref:Uncharacterized protein n=1 Tax=candidate division WWE3 bacterium TaxID=2053526 RepID=A0A7C1SPF8_UNCKA|nr:hypothetical protein [candidate division WWE3 bacterium]
MIWIVLGLLAYTLVGFLLVSWVVGDFTLTASYPAELILLVAFWPFCLRGLVRLRIFRIMMQKQIESVEAWAESKNQNRSDS